MDSRRERAFIHGDIVGGLTTDEMLLEVTDDPLSDLNTDFLYYTVKVTE